MVLFLFAIFGFVRQLTMVTVYKSIEVLRKLEFFSYLFVEVFNLLKLKNITFCYFSLFFALQGSLKQLLLTCRYFLCKILTFGFLCWFDFWSNFTTLVFFVLRDIVYITFTILSS